MITRNGRERLVTISVDEYRRLRRSDRQVLRIGELSDADFAALEETRAPESSGAFDDELKSVGVCRFPNPSPVWSSATAVFGPMSTNAARRRG
jgi:hypothetical protein